MFSFYFIVLRSFVLVVSENTKILRCTLHSEHFGCRQPVKAIDVHSITISFNEFQKRNKPMHNFSYIFVLFN